jgi:hypothetical protein
MNESDYNELREASWQRKLTAAEDAALQAWLAEHPGSQADRDSDLRLSELLERLPDAPVPSNFTARVLQAVERDASAESRPVVSRWSWVLRSLLPKAAAAAVVLTVAMLTYHENTVSKRAEVVQGVKVVAGVPSLPSPEVLQNFDTIRNMGNPSGPDLRLIALMSYH